MPHLDGFGNAGAVLRARHKHIANALYLAFTLGGKVRLPFRVSHCDLLKIALRRV